MAERLTAFDGRLEFTTYDDTGAVESRRVVAVSALETKIPDQVKAWLAAQVQP